MIHTLLCVIESLQSGNYRCMLKCLHEYVQFYTFHTVVIYSVSSSLLNLSISGQRVNVCASRQDTNQVLNQQGLISSVCVCVCPYVYVHRVGR